VSGAEQRHEEFQAAMQRRRAACLQEIATWQSGDANLDTVLDRVVEIWTGDADRIVRIGTPHNPEVQT
jgi:hypothetical protein